MHLINLWLWQVIINKIINLASYVPSNLMDNRRVPKFLLNNCAQSSKKMFMCPKFRTYSGLKYTQCHISTNLSNFLKLYLQYCQKLLALAATNRRFAEKNRLSGNTAGISTWLMLIHFNGHGIVTKLAQMSSRV